MESTGTCGGMSNWCVRQDRNDRELHAVLLAESCLSQQLLKTPDICGLGGVLPLPPSGSWTPGRRCSVEGLLAQLASARPHDFSQLGIAHQGMHGGWQSGCQIHSTTAYSSILILVSRKLACIPEVEYCALCMQ
jgi:hypothetical protein